MTLQKPRVVTLQRSPWGCLFPLQCFRASLSLTPLTDLSPHLSVTYISPCDPAVAQVSMCPPVPSWFEFQGLAPVLL